MRESRLSLDMAASYACDQWMPSAAGPRLRPDDLGQLWEHYVLNELTAQLQTAGGCYWRDKQGHEVDLTWAPRGKSPTAIECKWSTRDFNPANLLTLRPRLSQGNIAGADARPAFTRNYSGAEVQFLALDRLAARIASN
jgi:hypothetical protein